jgi:hypothetical protein
MVRHRHPALLAALLVLLAALASACGGGQGGSAVALPDLRDLGPAAQASGNADSASFEMTFEMSTPVFPAPLEFSTSGAFDTPAKRVRMSMDFGAFAKTLAGLAGSLGGDAPEGLDDPAKWKLEMLFDDTVAYMKMPLLASRLPSGKEWISVDLQRAAQLQGLDLGSLESYARGSDPRSALDYLRSVSGKLTRVGTEDLRGVPTAHYFAVVDWQKAVARAAKSANQPGLLDQFESLGTVVQNIPVDVWVDADNLVRKMTMTFSAASGGQQANASLSLELFDYGKPVSFDVPPAGDVVDALSLRG